MSLMETKLLVATADFSNEELTMLLRASMDAVEEAETEEDYQENLLKLIGNIKKKRKQ